MLNIITYSIISVLIVSTISLVGVFTLSIKIKKLQKLLLHLVSFSAGALFGDVFIHLLPEVAKTGIGLKIGLYTLAGICFSFIIEKFVRWRHCHIPTSKKHIHPFAVMSLISDAIHNFIDGLIIASSYIINIEVGIATTLAVIFHEIPQEIGDYGVLIYGGFTKWKALSINFLIGLTSIGGAIIALVLNNYLTNMTNFLIPFAAGGFIYIAGSDLIPELHKELKLKQSIIQLIVFMMGIGVMVLLLKI